MFAFRLTIILLTVLTLNTSELNAQWTQVLPPQSGYFFALKLKGTLNFFAGSSESGVFRTTNGTDWEPVDTGLTDLRVHSFAVMGTNLFAGTLGGVFLSTNNGNNWSEVNDGLTNHNVYPLAVIGANLFAGTSNSGVFLSTNNGTIWSEVNDGLTNLEVNALVVSGTNLFAGTNGGVFLSTDNGIDWTQVNSGLTDTLANCFTVIDTNLFVGTYGGGVFLSTNNGTSWTPASSGLTNLYMLSLLAVDGSNILAGTEGDGVFLSHNNGTNWTPVNEGLTKLSILSLAVVGDQYIFAGTSGGDSNGVWRRPFSEIITSVEHNTLKGLPSIYSLKQNYPNPFNPSTTISYSVPQSSQVQIIVYDMLGNEIETLVNGEKLAGTYEVTWYVETLPSGVYFYQLKTGSFTETKKMILLR
jgi:photosystem II stability/assembly factor-like uncharacterized protein